MIEVALCTDGVYPDAMGGMQRHSRLLAEHLARTGAVKLTVIHPHSQGIFDDSLGLIERTVEPINEDRTYLLELRRYSDRVRAILEELDPDVVLSQGFCVWNGLDKWGERTIVHPHGLEMFQGMTNREKLLGYPFRRSLRSIIRHSNTVISLGGKLTGILQDQAAGSSCKVVTIPNAVDIPDNPPAYPVNSQKLRLLFVGRFAFNKGLDILIEVARMLDARGMVDTVHFDLAGDGPLLNEIKQVGVPANVTLHGRVDDSQLEHLYETAHALVLPTRFEGMPTVVLEAMARKRPIIVSDVGATAEQVSMHNGYLIGSGSISSLMDAVLNMRDRSPEAWKKMGEYSYERALELFSWPSVTQQFLSLFKTVASGAGAEHQ
jgi:glycosyltransferase involved in cell wall biosynthesis